MSLTSQRFCENCGAHLEPGARFCEECGTPVGAIVGKAPPPLADLEPDDEPVASPPSNKPSSGPSPWLVQGAGVVLILALAGIGWWQRERLTGWLSAGKASPAEVATTGESSAAAPVIDASKPVAPTVVPPPTSAAPQLPQSSSEDMTEAQGLADMEVWLMAEPWFKALSESMPKGVRVTLSATPFNAEGWSDIELRENHLPESGFDVDVSPMIGMFRVSREGRVIQWMDAVSGEYVPLQQFLQDRGLTVGATSSTQQPRQLTPVPEGLIVVGGDFESAAPPIANRDRAVIVADPQDGTNHVARITGPDEMSFTLPVQLAEGTSEVAVTLKLLHPEGTQLIPFTDGPGPEGIRLRVRLLDDQGNSAIRDAVVRPTGQWREMEYVFYDLPKKVVQVSVEAIWMEGPVYVDDVRLATP
ncbi:MAG: zinc ribbon domain-containing protein [Verrucomicrobiaceae bacterium]|nr:zinc ribbon domain-containing protein [Verrucomicrobiaceae bacterium]